MASRQPNQGARFGRRFFTCAFALLPFFFSPARAANNAVQDRLRRDVQFLASDECEGRGILTKGINRAADYIAHEFKKAGLKPAGANGSYFQPFSINGPGELSAPNHVTLEGPRGQVIPLRLGEQFRVLGLSGSGKVTAPVVFAGYGISTSTGNGAYDDYPGLDAAGKVLVIIRKTPRWSDRKNPFGGELKRHYAALATKMVNADIHKAAAVLFVNDQELSKDDPLMTFDYTKAETNAAKAPAVHVRRALVDAMLKSSLGQSLLDVEKAIDKDLKPRSAALKGWKARVEVNVKRQLLPAKNVIGVLEGSGALARETVVIGAHYDHLGRGETGSLARRPDLGKIHHGADDNASGTTVLMELARRFGTARRAQNGNAPARRIVFIAFSGEEQGLLGSRHYCEHPVFPLNETVAMINMDMVGRLRPDPHTKKDKLIVYGTATSKDFDALLETLNKQADFQLRKVRSGYGPSDHSSFYEKKIPIFFFFTGEHMQYHKPSDTADLINVAGMARIADLVGKVLNRVATVAERPRYIKVADDTGPRISRMNMPVLGFMPGNYGDPDGGVLIGNVREGGPADKAGLKEGDRIVEVAGKPVRNMTAYVTIMRTQKRGQPLEIGILRKGKKMLIKATPQ